MSANAQIYVNSTEGIAGNDGSQMNNGAVGVGPVATLAQGIALASAGDTIYVLAGAYGEEFNISVASTIVVVPSGANTIATFSGAGADLISANTTISDEEGGVVSITAGAFGVTAATLSISGADALRLYSGVSVTLTNDQIGAGNVLTPALVTGDKINYAGNLSLEYVGDTSPLATAPGAEMPTDGDLGTGNLRVGDHLVFTAASPITTTGTVTLNASTDAIVFDDLTAGNVTQVAGTGSLTIADLTLTGALTVANSGAFGAASIDVGSATANGNGAFSVTGNAEVTGTLTFGAAQDDGDASIGGTLSAGAIDIDGDLDIDVTGATTVENGAYNKAGTGTFTTASMTLADDATLTNAAGVTTVSGAVTIDDGEVALDNNNAAVATNRIAATGGTINAGSIGLTISDQVGADVDQIVTITTAAASRINVTGAIVERLAFAGDNGGNPETTDHVIDITNAGRIDVGANTTLTGDITNTPAALADAAGMYVGAGATFTLDRSAAYTDLGPWGGAGKVVANHDLTGAVEFSNLDVADGFGNIAVAIDASGDVNLLDVTTNGPTTVAVSVDGTLTVATASNYAMGAVTAGTLVSAGPSTAVSVAATSGATIGGDVAGAVGVTAGDLTVNLGADIAGAASVDGDVYVTGSVNAGTSFADLDASGTVTVTGTAVFAQNVDHAAGNLVIGAEGSVTFTAKGQAAADGTLTVGDITIAQGGSLTSNDADFTISGDFTGGSYTGAAGNTVTFALGVDGATLAPGPNTSFGALTVTGQNRVLSLSEGLDVIGAVLLGNDAIVELNSNTLKVGGNLTTTDEAVVRTTSGTGTIWFDGGAAQTWAVADAPNVAPTFTNVRVDNAAGVKVTGDVKIDGDVSLAAGAFTADGATVTMTAGSASISRVVGSGSMTTANGGTFAGSWDLYYSGAAGDTSSEWSDGQIENVTINMSNQVTNLDVVSAATVAGDVTVTKGSVDFEFATTITGSVTGAATASTIAADAAVIIGGDASFSAGAQTGNAAAKSISIAGALTLPTGQTFAGTAPINLTGDATHTVAGTVSAPVTITGDAVVTGSALGADASTFGDIDVDGGGSATFNDLQVGNAVTVTEGTIELNLAGAANGDKTIASLTITDGSATLSAGTVSGDITVSNGTTLALVGDVTAGDNVIVGTGVDGAASVLDLGGNTLTVTDDFTGQDTASYTDGVVVMTGGALGTEGVTLAEVSVTGASSTSSNTVVTSLTVAAATTLDTTGDVLSVNDATLGASASLAGGTVKFLGGTVEASDNDATTAEVLGSTTFDIVDGDGFDVGTLTLTSGDVVIGGTGTDLTVLTALVYDADNTGTVTSEDDGQFVSDGITSDTNGASLYVEYYTLNDADNGQEDNVLVTDHLVVNAGGSLNWDDGAGDDSEATITVTDGGTASFNGTDANNQRDFTAGNAPVGDIDLTYAGGVSITYTWAVESGAELPSTSTALTISDPMIIGDAHTTDALDLTGALTLTAATDDMTVADGGTATFGLGASINNAGLGDLVYAGSASLVFDGMVATNTDVWPATFVPTAVTVTTATSTGRDYAVGDLTVQDDLTIAAGGTLTVGGDLVISGALKTIVTAVTEPVVMGGSETQSLSIAAASVAPDHLTINNAAGVELSGSDLDFEANGGVLTLTNGALITGDNYVKLNHDGTGVQGYIRTNGVISGTVKKGIETGGAAPNRVEFPLGDSDGNYRPYTITINDPVGDIGDLNPAVQNVDVDDIVLTATYVGSSPGGTNGLPIASTDAAGNSFSVGRYPEFHWNVESVPTLAPSVSYDVEFSAEGYDNFEGESIERVRSIRRADGAATNFWSLSSPVAGDNDNYAVSATEPVMVSRNATGAIGANGVLFTFGLEQNMVANAVAEQTVNAGGSATVDLAAAFSGGDGNFTYTVTSSSAETATGAAAGNTLTVTGVAAGTATLSVVATDGFGDTATATVDVTVNAAFEAAEELGAITVNVGADPATVNVSGTHTGGTDPVTYAGASSDAAVATVAVDGDGVATITFVAVGEATITVTATDGLGDEVEATIAVTVNAIVSNANPIAAVALEGTGDSEVDLTGVFAGGTGAAYTYSASSSSATVAVAVDGTTLTVTGVTPYVIVDGAVTADADDATITVTATDDLGSSASVTFTVGVDPVIGDVDGSGSASPSGASLTLDAFLGLDVLTAKQSIAADYNEDGSVTPYDAALIFNAFFSGKTEFDSNPQAEYFVADIAREGNIVTIPVLIGGDNSSVVSGHFATTIDPSLATVVGVTSDLGEGWLFNSVVTEDGNIILAFASAGGVIQSEGGVASISVELSSADVQFLADSEK